MNCFESCKDIDWSNLIQNASGVGTFIAAIIGLWTLRIIIRQRRDTFRPRVIFGNGFYAQCKARENNIVKTIWTNHMPDTEFNHVTFDLLNVGYGVAENVILTENWDIDKAIKFIKERDKDNELEITKTDDQLTIKTTFDSTFTIGHFTDKKTELGSILIFDHTDNKPNKYWFSDIYLNLLSCLSYIMDKHDRFLSLDDYPRMRFEIEYLDIEKTKYSSEYELKVLPITTDKFSFTIVKK